MNNVQALVRDLAKRGLDTFWDDHEPKKKKLLVLLPAHKVKTRPPSVLFFQTKSLCVKFQPGVLDSDELAFFL